jgi:hypothetical protein
MACKLGQRAEAEGKCPPGETCSDRTPSGLAFIGARAFNNADGDRLLPTAIGGNQTISTLYADSPHEPYVAGFEAKLIDSSIAMIESDESTSIVLRGVSEGTALLRLLEPRTNKLLDRVEIAIAPIAKVSLRPQELGEVALEPWAVLTGSRALLGVMLLDRDDGQIVDESLEVSAHAAEIARRAWDLYEVTPTASDSVSLAVRAGGGLFLTSAQVVSSIDDIVQRSPSLPAGLPTTVKLGRATEICFLARSTVSTVVGATWTFQASNAITIARRSETPAESSPVSRPRRAPPSCVTVSGTKLGPATLHVTAGNHGKMFNLVVGE